MAIASLVLGIISLVIGAFFPSVGWIGIIVGVVGIILAAIAKKNAVEKPGLATAGLVCSIIGVALSLILYLACVACVSGAAGLLMS